MNICKRLVHPDDHLHFLFDFCHLSLFVSGWCQSCCESGETGEWDESGDLDEYSELGLKRERQRLTKNEEKKEENTKDGSVLELITFEIFGCQAITIDRIW